MKSRLAKFALFLFLVPALNGCASFGQSLKSFLGGNNRQPASSSSQQRRMGKIDKKNYRKVTRRSMEEEADLGEGSGSLWISRGQGAYLFAQNTNRLIGDLINIEIDGHPKKQIETKVKVIEDLLQRITARAEARARARRKKNGNKRMVASDTKSTEKPVTGGKNEFPIQVVPSRIVEILKDGSYRVQGDQPFMIDKREYKLVVTGIIRQADFDDQGISAETLLDPKFDIVTSKSKPARKPRLRKKT